MKDFDKSYMNHLQWWLKKTQKQIVSSNFCATFDTIPMNNLCSCQ